MKGLALENIKRILIVRPDAIGDCILITPAISALKKRFPGAKITVLAQELTQDIFASNPEVDQVITRMDEIHHKKFDLSIHYFNELPYALLARSAGIKYRLGDRSKPLVSWLYNIKTYQNWRDITKHDVEQNMLLLHPLGINAVNPKLNLHVDSQALKNVEQLLKNNGVTPRDKIAGLHLGTGKGNKPWAPKNFGIVAEYLAQLGFKVVAAGQKKDHVLIEQAQRHANNKIINLSTKTSLKELIALTSKYKLFIGVDTGPYHIAAALGIPMVCISTSKFSLPLRWGPWNNRHVLVRKKSSCGYFCLPAKCEKNICAEEITPEEVKNAVTSLLAGGGNKTREEAFFDWCKKSFSIMIAYKKPNQKRAEHVHATICEAGFYAIMVDLNQKNNYQQLFKENNTNIIHALDHSLKLRFNSLISGKSLIIPVLYVKDNVKYHKFKEFFNLYQQVFGKSKI